MIAVVSDLELLADLPLMPAGFRPESDRSIRGTAYILGYDSDTREVTVGATADGEGRQVPAIVDTDWTSLIGDVCWVLRDTHTGAVQYALAPVQYPVPPEEPEPPAPVYPTARGTVTAISGGTITVDGDDGEEYSCTSLQTYTSPAVGDVVALLWSPALDRAFVVGRIGVATPPPPPVTAPPAPASVTATRSGSTVNFTWSSSTRATSYQWRRRVGSGSYGAWTNASGTSSKTSISQGQTITVQVRAVNSAGSSAATTSNSVTWPAPTPPPPQLVTRTVTITPNDTGTYRVSRGAWDRWNTDRFGGASTLYQGNAHGSGQLIGAAFYGNKVSALGAVTITRIRVLLRGAGLNESSFPAISLTGVYEGSRPGGVPSGAGQVFGGNPGQSGTAWATVNSADLEAWRVGVLRGLAVVGGGYAAVRGLSAADGMVLEVTFQVRQ